MFAGTRVAAQVRVSEAGLNEALAAASPVAGAYVELESGNRVRVRYGMLHAEATLPANVELGTTPQVTIVLSSLVVALSLRIMLALPFIRIHGPRVVVDLAAVPELAPVKPYWQYVRDVRLVTTARALLVSFDVEIAA